MHLSDIKQGKPHHQYLHAVKVIAEHIEKRDISLDDRNDDYHNQS